MQNNLIVAGFAKELQAEYTSTKKCLERIPESLYDYKPHEKSMAMGYLALLVADIPRWITETIKTGEVDFATYKHFELSTADKLLAHFEENYKTVVELLESGNDEQLEGTFYLKDHGKVLYSDPKKDAITADINHWVHHRGQLTVYMRMNNIPVPSIYGPSADEKGFQ